MDATAGPSSENQQTVTAQTPKQTLNRSQAHKRVATPENWKQNQVKIARTKGEGYLSPYNGKHVAAR